MSFRQRIIDELSDSLPGLKKDPGLSWLDNALVSLDKPETKLTTQAFLSAMKDSRSISGFLLEVTTAVILENFFPPKSVRTEVQEGTAKSPCDIIVETSDFRLDIQCKAIQSVTNELQIDELAEWLALNGTKNGLRSFFDLQVLSTTTESQLEAYRLWQEGNWKVLQAPSVLRFPPGDSAYIEVIAHVPEDLGEPMTAFTEGVIFGPVDDFDMATWEDVDKVRGKLISRIKNSRRTFGYVASPTQGNFLAVDLPYLGITDEESLMDALYGEVAVQCPSLKQSRKAETGLFSSGKFEYVSGLVLLPRSFAGNNKVPLVLFPHPKHLDLCKQLDQLACFRKPQDLDDKSLIPY